MTSDNGDLQSLWAKADAYLEGIGRGASVFSARAAEVVFIAVDMQNFVCDSAPGRELPGIKAVMERVNLLADFCHAHGIPVVWLRQCFTQKGGADDAGLYGLFHKAPLDPGMFGHGEAALIHPDMHLEAELDFVVEKNRYSAFAPGSSRLETLLSSLGRRHLVFGGAATNVCVECTARDAMQREYKVTVLSDATTAFDAAVHQISLLNIRLFFGDVKTVEEVVRKLKDSLSGDGGA